jgi:hypothetical protein
LRRAGGRWRHRDQHLVDLGIIREVRSGCDAVVEARDGNGGRHSIEAVRTVADDVDKG